VRFAAFLELCRVGCINRDQGSGYLSSFLVFWSSGQSNNLDA
jgi:hypothetical protein